MNEERIRAFLRRHIATLRAELDRMHAVLADIDSGVVRHLDPVKLRADLAQSIRVYEHSLAMWEGDLTRLGQL